jgi:hypothetical protein
MLDQGQQDNRTPTPTKITLGPIRNHADLIHGSRLRLMSRA